MSLLKTALACLLLAVLAPCAGGQTIRPATSKALGQYASFTPSASVAQQPAPLVAQRPAPIAEPAGPQAIASDSAESESTDGEAPLPDDPSPGPWNAGLASSGAMCGPGGCTDGSCDGCGSPASQWLGTYRFGGGNAGFAGPWYIAADALLLHRSNGNQNLPIVQDSNTGATYLSAQNLQFTSKVGPRLLLGYAWSHTTAFEVSYFGLIDSHTQAAVSGNGNLGLPPLGIGIIAPDFSAASQMNVSYNSRLNNAEFNVLRNTGCSPLSWLYGFRYLSLHEHLDINSLGSLGTADYATVTRNNMFGLQFGARYMFNYKRLAVETTAKAGVLENATQQSQNITDTALPGFPIRDTLAKGANVSYLGEIGINGIYRLTEKWALRFGYTLIWVDGLALAPNQLDYTFTAFSGTGLNHGGNVLMQAVNAGVELHW